ncbi:MAG: glycosyltransferase, partial [Bacteroides sp.]|nr:glycosyltransferase [Bacteroides sp.]
MYLGTIEERKNLLLLLKALKVLSYPVPVVAVGKSTSYTKKVVSYIEENELDKYVTIFNGVPFQDLPALYQMASLFVYPSRFEGFVIAILEAIYRGVTVIACTGPVW